MLDPDAKNIMESKIGVVGAGSWGTALANLLAEKGYPVDLWVFEKEVKDQILHHRENRVFLPEISLSDNLRPTNDLAAAVAGKDLVLVVVPSHVMRETAGRMADLIDEATIVVSASKGIENQTYLTMTGVLREMLPRLPDSQLAALSGPSFAKEVARRLPTAVTVACRELSIAERVQHVFATERFRVYANDDVMGVELGGSVKNVIAIAAGIIDGLDMGLITRGQTEIRRLGVAMGANPRTFTGLAGIGDLILTCTGTLSRNHTIGYQIGQGARLADLLKNMRMVAEGVKNAESIYNLSRRIDVEMPICTEVYRILYEDLPPLQAVQRLMTRELKHELDAN